MSGGNGVERQHESIQPDDAAASSVASPLMLESLAPRYDPEQHGTYLRHLEAQVANPKNLNIALTGRYGAGKSSVLDKFEEKHKNETLRLGISTLDPGEAGVGLNNRIQKELVKQLLYQASPGLLRHSRFSRIAPRSRAVTFVQSVLVLVMVGGLLAFTGWLPPVVGTGPEHDGWVRAASWAGFGLLLALALTVLRLAVLDRREISDVSAAGASVTLTTKNGTYFDEYLDEIVYFFDKEAPRYVIFEDIDRFDDPHIFEALRELNTLLNKTDNRKKQHRPLQFIYAIKDSLFEQLGTETKDVGDDAVSAETVRANRTKFFEVVIPVVPFISHRNARELLTDLLAERGITDIDRRLIDIVARYSTDMRLLRNICNEFQVFSERLLEGKHTAPGLTPSNLFALVAYKNYHLKDFEQISRRSSDLDLLYDASRTLVNGAIEDCVRRKRELSNGLALARSQRSLAKKLGERLTALGLSLKGGTQYAGWQYVYFVAGGNRHTPDEAGSYDFWRTVAAAPEISVQAAPYTSHGAQVFAKLVGEEHLSALFPEAFHLARWDEVDGQQVHERLDALDRDISLLRGADFVDLARNDRFHLPVRADEGRDETTNAGKTFAQLIDATMKSQLARDLVKQGYIDRNFALYAAQFYGHFVGVDVANFLVHNVQTNTMDIQYPFTSPGAVANLLAEAPTDFTHTVGALNISILDYLFSTGDKRAQDIVNLVMRHTGSESRQFLSAFLNADRAPERLAAALSNQGWPSIFPYLVSNEGIPSDRRASLVDAALLAIDAAFPYELDGQVCEFITVHYKSMLAMTMAQDPEITRGVAALLERAGVVIPELEPLAPALRTEVIRLRRYTITADNLRCALGVTGSVSLDVVHDNGDVYGYCCENADSYLHALDQDSATPYTIVQETTLVTVLDDVCGKWHEETITRLLSGASADSRLTSLTDAPDDCWSAMASAKLFRPTLRNVEVYRGSRGIDQPLADLLADSKLIETDGEREEVRQAAAVAILNASHTLPQAAVRVQLVVSLELEDYIEASAIEPEPGSLLTLLLAENLVNDSPEVFLRFRDAGWGTIEQAIAKSENFTSFFNAEIAIGFIPDLLFSGQVPSEIRDVIIDNLDKFVPDDDEAALRAVATYARSKRRSLPASQLRRIAAATKEPATVVSLLAISPPSPSEIVDVLAKLPEPYSYFATRIETEFEVPNHPDLQTLLAVMSRGKIVASHNKKRLQNTRIVKLS